MNEEEIRDEARKAANRSQLRSDHIYDHKSYEDGFYEGMKQALRQFDVIRQSKLLVDFSDKVVWKDHRIHIHTKVIEDYLKSTNSL